MAVGIKKKRRATPARGPPQSLRVRVVRPMADGYPITSRDARRLLMAVVKHRPFACSSQEREEAAWAQITDALSGMGMAPCDVEARFWYLLDGHTRHRMHGSALAGMSKGVMETLESIALCVNAYGYQEDIGDYDTGDRNSGDLETKESSHKSTTKSAIERAFSGLSAMKSLLTQSQRQCADQELQLHHLSVSNEQLHSANQQLHSANQQLHHENQQLQSQFTSLQHELDSARVIKTEHRVREDETATRMQLLRSVVQSLAAMLDADALDG